MEHYLIATSRWSLFLDQKGYVWKDKVYQQLIEELELDLSWHELLEDYMESFQNHCIGFPGLIEILDFRN